MLGALPSSAKASTRNGAALSPKIGHPAASDAQPQHESVTGALAGRPRLSLATAIGSPDTA